jgi:hypothetical protein
LLITTFRYQTECFSGLNSVEGLITESVEFGILRFKSVVFRTFRARKCGFWFFLRQQDLIDLSGLSDRGGVSANGGRDSAIETQGAIMIEPGISDRSGFVPISGTSELCKGSYSYKFYEGTAIQAEVCEYVWN